MTDAVDEPLIVEVNPSFGLFGCEEKAVCEKYIGQMRRRLIGRYIGVSGRTDQIIKTSVIPVGRYSFDEYMASVRKVHKGNAVRDAKKADRAGLYPRQFVWKNHLHDIVAINRSKKVRSGGVMSAAYRRGVEELGGAPTALLPLRPPACPVHTTYTWGLFEPAPGHKNGAIVTDERLVAYIKLKRQGTMLVYTSILGHGDYLRLGVMYRLHYAVMEWVVDNLDTVLKGVDSLLYGPARSGAEGLQMWKRRAIFQDAYLLLSPSASFPRDSG